MMTGELRRFLDTASGRRNVAWVQVAKVKRLNFDHFLVYLDGDQTLSTDGLTVYLAEIQTDDWKDGEFRDFHPPLSVLTELAGDVERVIVIDTNRLATSS